MKCIAFALILMSLHLLAADVPRELCYALDVTSVTADLADGFTFSKKIPGTITYSFLVSRKEAREIRMEVSLVKLVERAKKADKSKDEKAMRRLTFLEPAATCVVLDKARTPIFFLSKHDAFFILSSVSRRHELIFQTEHSSKTSFYYVVSIEDFPDLVNITG